MADITKSRAYTRVTTSEFHDFAGQYIRRVYADKYGITEPMETIPVWYCKTVQNHKGFFISDLPDARMFECTYNGDTGELYVDEYVKHSKTTFVPEEDT